MHDKIWKAAFAVGGLGAVGAFVFWSLYSNWLELSIFSKISSDQTFVLMLVFLGLTFLALVVLAFLHFRNKNEGSGNAAHAFELHKAWEGVNEVKCKRVIGPDVVKAARALTITSSSWLNNLVPKKIIIDNHFEDFEILVKELEDCSTIVPGFEEDKKRCCDFISMEMKRTYREMVAFKQGVKS